MYFWSIQRLKKKLAARPLTAREELPYVLAFFTLWTINAYSSVLFPQSAIANIWDRLSAGWSIALGIAGTIYIYRRNGGGEGEHFLQRFVVIGWVVTVRWFVWVMPVLLFYYAVLADLEDDQATWHEFVLFGVCEAILYWRTGHHVAALRLSLNSPAHTTNGHSAL